MAHSLVTEAPASSPPHSYIRFITSPIYPLTYPLYIRLTYPSYTIVLRFFPGHGTQPSDRSYQGQRHTPGQGLGRSGRGFDSKHGREDDDIHGPSLF